MNLIKIWKEASFIGMPYYEEGCLKFTSLSEIKDEEATRKKTE